MTDCGTRENCQPCVTPSLGSHVIDVAAALRDWLIEITCIPWYRAYPEGAEPKGLFGVVEITEIVRVKKNLGEITLIDDETACQVIEAQWEYTIALTAKGTKLVSYDGVEHTLSAMDVLANAQDSYHDTRLADLLPFSVSEWLEVESLVKENSKCCWENSAQTIVKLCVKRETSRKVKVINAICLKLCDDEIKCPELIEDCE